MSAIVFENVSKSFGRVSALEKLNLSVERGEIVGIIGPNGAGKSTSIRTILGLTDPDSGSVLINGVSPAGYSTQDRVSIGWVAQQSTSDPLLSGRESLTLMANLYGLPDVQAAVDAQLDRYDLRDSADRPVRTYSGGMLKKLEIAIGTIHNPEILILDEPTVSLDPTTRLELWGLIREMKAEGRTVVIATHYLEEAEQLCDRIAIVDQGAITAVGTIDELRKKYSSTSLHEIYALSTGSDIDPVTGTNTTASSAQPGRINSEQAKRRGETSPAEPSHQTIGESGAKSPGWIRANYSLTLRWFWRLRRDRYSLILALLQPVLWLVLFGQIWDGLVDRSWAAGGYLQFMAAGAVMMSVFNFALVVGLELLLDRERGTFDRIRVAPVATTSITTSRLIYTAFVSIVQTIAVIAVAGIVGVGFPSPFGSIPLLIGTATLLAIGVGAISAGLGLALNNHGKFYSITGLAALPAILLSTVFAPVDAMPEWLRVPASINPISFAVNAARELTASDAEAGTIVSAYAALLVFVVAMLGFSFWATKSRTSD